MVGHFSLQESSWQANNCALQSRRNILRYILLESGPRRGIVAPMSNSASKNNAMPVGQHVKVAVVQAAPVAFDRERTLEKVHALAGEAARQGAQLALFPEAFVSAYPRGLDFGAVVGSRTEAGREDFRRYWESSVDVPGPAVDDLSRAARRNNLYLVIGVVERDRGTLY